MRRLAFVRLLAFVAALLVGTTSSFAVEPDERLADSALESRARDISAGLRCLICQNQSIDDSSAPLARDLRILVREQIKAGKNDADIERFLVDRYGEFVLLRPRFGLHTVILWLAPFALLGGIAVALWRRARAQAGTGPAVDPSRALSVDEQQRLDRILGETDRTL